MNFYICHMGLNSSRPRSLWGVSGERGLGVGVREGARGREGKDWEGRRDREGEGREGGAQLLCHDD